MLKLRGSEGHLGARHGNRSPTTTVAIRWGGFQFCHAINSLRRLSVPLHNWACQAPGQILSTPNFSDTPYSIPEGGKK